MDPVVFVAVSVAVLALVVAVVAVVNSRRRPESLASVVEATGRVEAGLQRIGELFLVPQTRGVVGETLLAELLSAWLPRKSYELQYSFKTGTRVDAVVRLGSKLVPIDSKFPLESATRFLESNPGRDDPIPGEVRKSFLRHIGDIAERYIRPDENTMAFALMYIPSERLYMSIFVERPDELLQEALRRNVVPVSPGTLFAYLQTVAYGLRGLALPENARALAAEIAALRSEVEGLRKTFDIAGGHLRNLSRSMDEASTRLNKTELRADRLSGLES